MRKKYLSALLFGALLFASAGTFTSCKDYDDDIKNLQEQINTVKTSLDELTTKVNSLGAGVTDFKYENGQLVIVTDKGTNFTVDVPECEGIVKLEIKDGVLYADNVAVGNVSGDGGSVVEIKDGVIYINGKAEGELGNKVAVKDNGDGTYTLTVDGKNYVLPKAVAGNVTIEIKNAVQSGDNSFFTEIEAIASYTEAGNGIAWGTAAEAKDWDGPKGNVAAGQFLVGLTNTMEVEVTPNNTQLDAMKLQLVDTKGNLAPVVITAVSKNGSIEGTTSSRATDAKGQWVLSIAMDETVSADNMGNAFATSEDGSNVSTSIKNKLYALSCDGRLLTGYEIAVDTDEEATEDASASLGTYTFSKVYIGGTQLESGKLMGDATNSAPAAQEALPLNTPIKLEYRASDAYDYKFSIAKQDVNDAEKYGVKLEDNVLTASDKAANQKIHFDLKVMGVDGVVYTYEAVDLTNLGVIFGKTTTDAGTLAETKFKVNAASEDQVIVINLGETFSSLTADEAVSLNDATWTLVDPENEDNFIVAKANLNSNISYYQDEACTQEVDFDDTADNIKKIKYAKIDAKNAVINKTKAEVGDYTLTLTLSSDAGQVKKVQAPVSISLPTFDELFAKSAAWDGSTAVIRLSNTGVGDFLTVYKTDLNLATNGLVVKFNQFKVNGVDKSVVSSDEAEITSSSKTFTIEEAVIDNDTHTLRDVVVGNVEYKVLGADKFVIKSGKFDVKFLTALDGAKLVYYVDGKEAQMTVNGPAGQFDAYKVDGDGLDQGVAIVTGGKATLVGTINGVDLSGTQANWVSSFDSKAGNSASATVDTSGNLSLSDLSQGATGEYTTEMTMTYEGIVEIGTSTVNSSVKATVKVNN